MTKFLATYSEVIDNIEINGFVVMTEKEMLNYERLANEINWPFYFNWGDEEIEYSSGDDLLTRIDFKEITSDESKLFKRLFENSFGAFVSEKVLIEAVSDDDDNSDDDDDWRE